MDKRNNLDLKAQTLCPVLADFFCKAEKEIARIAARFSD